MISKITIKGNTKSNKTYKKYRRIGNNDTKQMKITKELKKNNNQ
jgi:hypothetical protein